MDDALTVSTFTVAGVAGTFNAGQIAILSGVGLLSIAANGDYTFTPLANWNGVVPQVTYTVSTGSSSTLDITVTPVNDAPTVANPIPTRTPPKTPRSTSSSPPIPSPTSMPAPRSPTAHSSPAGARCRPG